ncbi:hypothetical protein AB5I41_23565 [Sphingomonas sp. MMS24-JH45]
MALTDNEPVGAAVIVASADILGDIAEPATAGLLTKVTAPPAASGAAPAGHAIRLWRARRPHLRHRCGGQDHQLHAQRHRRRADPVTDRLGAVTTRTYDAPGRLRREERQEIATDARRSVLGTAYAYDVASRLRYSVSPEGQGDADHLWGERQPGPHRRVHRGLLHRRRHPDRGAAGRLGRRAFRQGGARDHPQRL